MKSIFVPPGFPKQDTPLTEQLRYVGREGAAQHRVVVLGHVAQLDFRLHGGRWDREVSLVGLQPPALLQMLIFNYLRCLVAARLVPEEGKQEVS